MLDAFPSIRRLAGRAKQSTALAVSLLGGLLCAAREARAVGEGESTQSFPAVVHLRADGGVDRISCTGIVVTPHWILTANHCVTGRSIPCAPSWLVGSNVGWGGASGLTVNVRTAAFDPVNTQPTSPFTAPPPHTVLQTTQVEFCAVDSARKDLALLRVAQRISPTLITPLHPPLVGVPACDDGEDITRTIVGYGPTTIIDPDPKQRNFSESDGWERDFYDPFAVWHRSWDVPFLPDPTTDPSDLGGYAGIFGGDSGGPLLQGDRLCGVASGVFPENRPTCSPLECGPLVCCSVPTIRADFAAVDSPGALQFLADNIVLSGCGTSRFDGECFGFPGSDNDVDGDGIPDECDNCPPNACNEFAGPCTTPNPNQADTDCDGVGDACDRCPGASDLVDPDGDGCPTACDPCPLDGHAPPFDLSCGDADGDGICRSADNCPGAPNPLQSNQNELSESIHTITSDTPEGLFWGDVCEPVPQPMADPVVTSIETLADIESDKLFEKVELIRRDRIAVLPQPARAAPNFPSLTLVPPVPVPDVTTHFRFCQPNDEIDCTESAVINDGELHLELPDATAEDSSMPYHRVSMGTSASSSTYDYDGATFDQPDWDFEADVAFWNTTGIVAVPPDEEFLDLSGETHFASGLDGTFWVHAATDVGSGAPGSDNPVGVHGQQLANRYFPIDPESIEGYVAAKGLRLDFPFLIRLTLPDPEWRAAIGEIYQVHLMTEVVAGEWGLVDDDATAQIVTDQLGPFLQMSLSDHALVWASASEVSPFAGGLDAPFAVALSADGSTVVETAVQNAAGNEVAGKLDRVGVPAALAASAVSPVSPRVDFQVAYSRSRRTAYLVGGRDAVSGAMLGTIWRVGVEDDSWVQLQLAIPVGHALATVYSPSHSLYVLDEETTAPGHATARLLRYDAVLGGGEVVATWPRKNKYDRYFLELDRDGSLLLVATSAERHAIARVQFDETVPRAAIVRKSGHALVWPVLVDRASYGIYELRKNGDLQVSRPAELAGPLVSVSDLDGLL